MQEDDIKGIRNWVENQGYSLEMAVAKILVDKGFGVWQSPCYEDPETKETREIDILAFLSEISNIELYLQLIIECKYSSNPIIAFIYTNRLKKSILNSWLPANDDGNRILLKIMSSSQAETIPILQRQGPIAYSLKQAPISKENTKIKNKDITFEAIFSVIKAAFYEKSLMEKYRSNTKGNNGELIPRAIIGIPTIVFKAPLYTCRLENGICIEPVESLLLEWRYPKVGTTLIRVIQDTYAEAYSDELLNSMSIIKSNKFNIL